jgi:hypothetical protein
VIFDEFFNRQVDDIKLLYEQAKSITSEFPVGLTEEMGKIFNDLIAVIYI